MSLSRRYRDQPVEPVNRTPRSAAYACFTEEGYTVARDAFHSKFLSLTSEVGPWAEDTLTTLYNYLIASIKLCNYGEAEEQCRYILGMMETLNMGEEHCFISLECILATSYFLSGKPVAAEKLFTDIDQRGDLIKAHVRGQFDVLSLVRLTTKDCLVFWQSPVRLPSILVPVTDYVDQLERDRPRKGLIRSGIGSLRRVASLIWQHPSASSNRDGTDDTELRALRVQKALHQATATSMSDFGFEKRYTKSNLSMLGPLEAILTPGAAANGNSVAAADIRSDAVELGNVTDVGRLEITRHGHIAIEPVQYKVAGWLEYQKQHPPMPDEPPDEPSDDAANGLTFRSMETTSSSLHGQKPQNQLEITLWAGDIPGPRTQLTLSALLDGGADKTCMSEDCAQVIRAPIAKENVQMTTANGQRLEILGSVRIGFLWKGPSGSRVTARVKCFVVKDLQPAILFCENHITKLKLRDSSSLLAPILLGARSKQTKLDDAQRSKEIADLVKANEQRESERRKAERAKLEQVTSNNHNHNQKPRATMDSMLGEFETSLLGGSSTDASSQRSSLTGFDRSITTTPSDESSRRGASMDYSPCLKNSRVRNTGHRRSKAHPVNSFELLRK
ncbi:hypothetical protein LTR46_007967 [Exophiala xenobiotica]|nr:hypothetical protein LTR46_007967 [Exophiala xenobiotica]